MFVIEYAESVWRDLAQLRAYDRKVILDATEKHLAHEPLAKTRRRKLVFGLTPPWEHVPPIWELRVGEYRVFYDVDEALRIVKVRAIRHKPAHRSTKEIV
jgi:mRNA-degrading endonuclease RelE of RelBE toxin-antitoxin system